MCPSRGVAGRRSLFVESTRAVGRVQEGWGGEGVCAYRMCVCVCSSYSYLQECLIVWKERSAEVGIWRGGRKGMGESNTRPSKAFQ